MTKKSSQYDQPTIIPYVEEDIVLPKNAAEAMPELTPTEELEMRANTIKLMSDLMGQDIEIKEENIKEAEGIAREMASNPTYKPVLATYKNETLAYLAGLVQNMNAMVVDDLAELKLYVVNKLLYEAEHAKDSKVRISALSKLGEVDGVDAFKKRTEVIVKHQTMEEVEDELSKTLTEIRTRVKVIDAEFTEVKEVRA